MSIVDLILNEKIIVISLMIALLPLCGGLGFLTLVRLRHLVRERAQRRKEAQEAQAEQERKQRAMQARKRKMAEARRKSGRVDDEVRSATGDIDDEYDEEEQAEDDEEEESEVSSEMQSMLDDVFDDVAESRYADALLERLESISSVDLQENAEEVLQMLETLTGQRRAS
jgi:hypothetical protein